MSATKNNRKNSSKSEDSLGYVFISKEKVGLDPTPWTYLLPLPKTYQLNSVQQNKSQAGGSSGLNPQPDLSFFPLKTTGTRTKRGNTMARSRQSGGRVYSSSASEPSPTSARSQDEEEPMDVDETSTGSEDSHYLSYSSSPRTPASGVKTFKQRQAICKNCSH